MFIKNKLFLNAICAGFFFVSCPEQHVKKAEPVAVAVPAPVVDEAPSFTNPIIPNGAGPG